MKTFFKKWKFVLFFFVFSGSADINEDNRIEHLTGLLNTFKTNYYQQKIYLHFDKPSYTVGEDIWFKAYVVDGSDHTPDLKSSNLYVEFINPDKILYERKRLQLNNGIGLGDFILSDTMPEGLYQVRAYTNWMRNFDGEFYFSRNISIKNSGFTHFISPSEAKRNKRELKNIEKKSNLDFQFFPEGGNMVAGLQNVVAFKAIDKLGMSVDVKGTVYDSKKNKITEFSSFNKGMGQFNFMPERDEKYYALLNYAEEEIKVNLPESFERGVVIKINNLNKREIDVKLLSNRLKSVDRFSNEVIVIAQIRGNVIYKGIQDLSQGEVSFSINKKGLPSGVAQITVFTGRFVPLAERLVFINNDDKTVIDIKQLEKNKDNLTEFKLKTSNEGNIPVKSNLSVSLIDASKIADSEFSSHITDYILLTSDLKGYIEDPSFYFKDDSEQTIQALDNLMLTQGWRRFDWNKLVKNEFPKLTYDFENKITIDGRITTELFDRPLENAEVTLTIMDEFNDVFTQKTSKDGSFKFEGFVYYDTLNVRLEAVRHTGRKNLLIVLEEPVTEEIKNMYGDYSLTTISKRDNKEYRKQLNTEYKEQVKLEEKHEAQRNKVTGIYENPDAVIKGEDIPDSYDNVLQAIQGRVPGVNVNGNNVIIRGVNTFYGSTEPLYLLDGIPVSSVNDIISIPVNDVDRIEILKGPSAAIYGSRGGNGVIAIYTKRGEFLKKGIIEFEMLGYSTPRQFYQPKFETLGMEDYIPSTLIWLPVVETNSSGEATIFIELPEQIKKYRMVVEGISDDGKPGSTSTVF